VIELVEANRRRAESSLSGLAVDILNARFGYPSTAGSIGLLRWLISGAPTLVDDSRPAGAPRRRLVQSSLETLDCIVMYFNPDFM
jgi:hypothetical protein